MKRITLGLLCGWLAVTANFASAGSINVLWLSGTDTYNNNISQLAAGGVDDASTYDPNGDGSNSWNIDFWDSGTPDFSGYDALVIGSTCRPVCGGTNGFFNLGVQPDLVLDNNAEIAAARGARTFVSGQDADWHYMNDPGDSADARAFLVNAVNWAAVGDGLGIVALADGFIGSNNGWLDDPDSFLAAEIGDARFNQQNQSVIIPPGSADFPINEGLTSSSLSNWGTSAHTAFEKALLPDGWLAINDAGFVGNVNAITIVTASEADGGTVVTPVEVPEPASIALFGLGLLAMSLRRRRA